MVVQIADVIEFDYVNWEGKHVQRKVEVVRFHFGTTDYYEEPQWLLEAYDVLRNVKRTYAIKKMTNVKKA